MILARLNFLNFTKRFFSLSKAVYENDSYNEIKSLISPSEKLRMKQKLKEAKRTERLLNHQEKLSKKQKLKSSLTISESEESKTFFPVAYDPVFIETKWYDHWLKLGVFNIDSPLYKNVEHDCKFSICLPPPNITGSLHIGHALGCSIQDAICRWNRMKGKLVTWVPGCDHAGIATQVVVEKHLLNSTGSTRHHVGREAFIEEVFKWKDLYGGQILEQMKRMGCSLDWSRMTFTLDERHSKAVDEAFVRLFDSGLIYRSKRLVNWSCALKSVISDIEVDNIELEGPTLIKVPNYKEKVLFGKLITFAYPVLNSNDEICVSTTRLETMLGDVGVAVHPSDGRYQHLIGRHILHPLTNQILDIVADESVDPSFGTGAVKLTPGHDPSDFEMARRHNLKVVNIMDDDGNLTNVPQPYLGLPRYEARKMLEDHLETLNLFRYVDDNPMSLPICSRSGDVVEYVLKEQWFVKCGSMAQNAIEAVESGNIEFVPANYKKQWNDWLLNIRDWCISRQLWWGHQVPAYKIIKKNGCMDETTTTTPEWVAARSESEARNKIKRMNLDPDLFELKRDEDVLDTWFSSSLVPFSWFGWPDETVDLYKMFPTDLLETASDIMFFWVARMVMISMQLTGKVPFKKVLFHSIVQDAKGRKMSKSLGNVIDPMYIVNGVTLDELITNLTSSNLGENEIEKAKSSLKREFPLGIPECGADALRFALLSHNFLGHQIMIDVNHFKYCRAFCNKIWQSYKYFNLKLKEYKGMLEMVDLRETTPMTSSSSPPSTSTNYEQPLNTWILSRLSDVVQTSNNSFDNLHLFEAVKSLQRFWWMDFCNVYLECTKKVFDNNNKIPTIEANRVICTMVVCFDTFLKLLHPFMPFLTEHIYQDLNEVYKLNHSKIWEGLKFGKTISLVNYPNVENFQYRNEQIEQEVEEILKVASKLNALKVDLKIEKMIDMPIIVVTTNEDITRYIQPYLSILKHLTKFNNVNVISSLQNYSTSNEVIHVCDFSSRGSNQVYMHLKGFIDVRQQLDRLQINIDQYTKERTKLMSSEAFNRTEHDHHLLIKEKVTGLTTIIEKLDKILQSLAKIENIER